MNNEELLAKIEILERALEKACVQLSLMFNDLESEKFIWDVDDWERWARNDNE